MGRRKRVGLIFVLIGCLIMTQLFINVSAVYETAASPVSSANCLPRLYTTTMNFGATTGITSDACIGELPSGVTIDANKSTIASPSAAKFSFTSDDGSNKDYTYRDVFSNRGVSCTIPLVENYVTGRSTTVQIALAKVLELQNIYGYEIGSHSYDHIKLKECASMEEVIFQLSESKRSLTSLGLKIHNFYVPFGSYTEDILDEASKLYRAVRTSVTGVNTPLDKRNMKTYWLDGNVSLQQAKQYVDVARQNNHFVIFGFHATTASRSFMDNTVGTLIDYIQSFEDTQVLTVDKALDRLENVITENEDYRVVDNTILLDKFFVRSLPIGENTLTLAFSDGTSETVTLNISKTPPTKTGTVIKITSLPAKMTYHKGQSLDSTGMVVTAFYNDGSFETVTDWTLVYDFSAAGTQTVSVTHRDKKTTFEVIVVECTPGDVNGDGAVNAKDVTLLRRYLANWEDITLDVAAADVNGDGVVNVKDGTILRRYIANGNMDFT